MPRPILIGVPKKIKNQDLALGLHLEACANLSIIAIAAVEAGAGLGIGFDNEAYAGAGAAIAGNAAEVFAKADMIVKVKEPQAEEIRLLRSGQISLHLSASCCE